MGRFRVLAVAVVFLLAFIGGLLFWPVVLTYTFTLGERATAQVAECHYVSKGKSRDLVCTGTWRTDGGRTGSGEIYGLLPGDAGRRVSVRIGPMGPYHGGFGRSWPLYTTLLPLLLAPPTIFVLARRQRRVGGTMFRELLAGPADEATVLVVTRKGAAWPDGRRYATVRATAPPPGHVPVQVPGRKRRGTERSTFEVAAGIGGNARRFAAVDTPAGEPLFLLEYRSDQEYQPEAILLGLDGTARAVIRLLAVLPARYQFLDPEGGPLGSVKTIPGAKWGAYVVRDQSGREIARVAQRFWRIAVRIEPTASPAHRDLALAFVFAIPRM